METTLLDKSSGSKNSSPNNFSNYLSGISGMIAPVTTDIKGVYDEYNQKIQTPLEQNFNVANYNELANLGPTYMDMSGYKKMSGKDIFIDSQFVGAAEGAAAGMSLGPWGALGGAISGNAMHLWKDLAHNNVGMDNYQSQVNSFNTRQIQNYNNNLTSSLDKLNYDYMKNQKVNYALGGEMLGQPTNQVTEFNTGGSHETNPYGGIPQGFGMNNMQNTVEEGEVKYNNFIFSKRVYPTKDILNKFNLPVSYFGLSIADIAKRLNKEGKERPSDPISNKGKDAMYERLQQAQEYQKVVNEAKKNGMTPEQYMQAMQQQPQEQQNSFAYGGQKDPPVANYSVVNSNDGTSKSSSNEQGLFDNIIESYPVLNPKNWGVEDFSHHKEFNNAYEDARTKGLQEFMWNGKRYNTQNSGTPTQQYSMYGNVNAQVNSEVSDKTATRILQNSLTHNGVDPELLERNFTINTLAGFPEYENTALSPLDSKLYNIYLNKHGLPSSQYTDKDRNTFIEEKRKRSMYNMITGKITGQDYIDEEAHGYQGTQYKENDLITMAKYWINNPFFTEEQQYKIYDDPNSYEYDAHTIVQPVLEAYQKGDISKDEIPIYIKNMQQHKEEAFLWQPYTLGDRHYQRNLILQSKLRDMGANLREDHDGVIGENTLRALKQYQTAINNNQPVRFTYFDKDELVNINYKNASDLDKILIEKELSNYGFDAKTPGASGFSEEAVQKRLEMFKKLYEAVPGKTEELIPVQPQYNATPNKYGKPKKNITKSNGTREYKGFNNVVNSFAYGGAMDGPGDPPFTQQDNTRVQQNNLPYNHLINQQQAAEDFIKSYIAQTAYMNSSQIGEYNKTLNAKERAVVSSLPNNVADKARQSYIDNHQGNVTTGKNISWWDDYKETAAGQNMVKFFNSPVTQELIAGLTIGFGSLPTATKGATFVPKITANPVSKAIAESATIGIPAFIGMGLNVDAIRIAKEQAYDMQMKYNNLKNIEQQIVAANTRGDVKGLEQAVATWQQTIDSYGFKDYSLQRGTPVYNVLQEQQLINLAGKPVGLFNNKIDTDPTSSTTSTTNTQGAFIPPILKNHKVTNVNGNITTFDNGVTVIKDSSGDYIIQHPTNSLGMRLESYEASNKKQSDGFFDPNNYGYIGSYDEVVNKKTNPNITNQVQPTQTTQTQTSTNQPTTKPNTTTNSRQSYSGNTSNYTPIDYDSEKGRSYTQKYDSIQDLDKLYQDWKTTYPNSEYTSNQFQILAYDNKWGPVHDFIYNYTLPTTNNSNTTKPTTSTTNTVDLSGMNAAPGWDDLPETVVTPTTEEAQTNNWNRWKEAAMFFNPARLAPIFNDLYNLSNQEGADPTLANSIRGAYTPIQAEQFGQQMAFTPFDWRANEIAQRAKAQSAQRTMMNIAGGNTAAATANLALQNAINQGDIAANYRQGIEYNNAQMATALGFNNQLDQANAMNRQQVNQANNANYMNSLINSAQVWDQEKKLIEQTRGQNQNMLAQNLGGLGQDYVNFNMINNNPALLYSMFGNYKGK